MTKEVWLEKGNASQEAGRYSEALKHFQAAIELDNTYADAWYGRAGTLVELAQYKPSVDAYEQARKLDSARYSAIALFGIGNCYIGLGDRRRAIRYYDQALQEAPQLERVWHNRGTALFELGLYEEAANSYARELEIEPASVKSRIWKAYCVERLGRSEPDPQQDGTPQEIATAWMEIATHVYKAGDLEHALAASQRAAAVQPSMGFAWAGQGACFASLGRWQDALQALDHAISLDDDSRTIALAHRVAVLKNMGRQGESEESYDRLLNSSPTSVEDHKAKVFGLYAAGRYEEALQGLAVFKRLDPRNAEAWYLEGMCLDALGRFVEAADSFGEFLQRKPENPRAWFRRARALTALGKADQAVECCEKAIALGFTTEESWFQKGITLAHLECYREAIPCMDKALEQKPGWDEVLYNRGVCHYHLGDHDSATSDFDEVLEQGSLSRYSLAALHFKQQSLAALGQTAAAESCQITAKAYAALGDEKFDDAVQLFRQALVLDAKNAAASLRLVALLVGRGDPNEALEQLAHALALRPQNTELWSTRGVVFARLGQSEEGLKCYAKALEIDPLYLPALRNSAIGLVEMGRFQEALDRYTRALSLEDQNANAWYGRGVCLARLGQAEEAVKAFHRAVELAPQDAEAWHDLGTCLMHVNNYREALEAWQKAARLNPNIDLGEKIRQLQSATDNSGRVRFLSIAAYHYFNQKNFQEAARFFDAALELDPRQDALWNDRGICAEQIEGPAQAIEFFDRALALDAEQPQTWYNKAVSLQHLRKLPDAVAAFEKELAIHEAKDLPVDENLLHGHHNLASCLILLGKTEEALDHCDEVLALARENPQRWQEEARRAQSLKKTLLEHSAARLA